ncbi:hypothetical protein GQ53DRAFT_83224 [Thozetella sp. PMI_491]|nr:hypothetical protein GQ53DRAFT_83224 [Thozetella sp. PMI_491]
MQLAITLAALMAAGAGASPIEARQIIPGKGSISLYSEPGCHASNALAEDVAIVAGCTSLDIPVATVKFNGSTSMGGLGWERNLHFW